jgi:phosphatidylglycerol lysyltransferase
MPASATERARAIELLQRCSRSSESVILRYDAPWRYLFGSSVEDVVAWIESHRVAVVWGDPICSPGNEAKLVSEFARHVRVERLKACMLLVEEPAARAALHAGFVVVHVGGEAIFDLTTWRLPRGDSGKSLRWCLNRARRAGLEIGEYRAFDGRRPELEQEIADVVSAWESSLPSTPARSILQTSPLLHVEDKRLFTARRDGRLQAVLACSPVPAANGWYLEDLVRVPDAAVGASELLVVSALERLAFAGAQMASLGVAPSLDHAGQIDRRARLLLAALRPLVSWIDRRYRFDALTTYKEKFRPTSWRPRYVAVLPPRPSMGLVRAIRAVLG